jgi:hypothetical protein
VRREHQAQLKDKKLREALAFTEDQANAFNQKLEQKQQAAEARVQELHQ